MFITQAYAQGTAAPGLAGGLDQLSNFAPIVLMIVVFYFLLLRPQQRKAKMHREMVSNLRRGDRVLTQGGILGQVSKVISDGEVQVEIAEGVRVRMLRTAISEVLTKTEPVGGGKDAGKDQPVPANDEAKDGDATAAAPASTGQVVTRPVSILEKLFGKK